MHAYLFLLLLIKRDLRVKPEKVLRSFRILHVIDEAKCWLIRVYILVAVKGKKPDKPCELLSVILSLEYGSECYSPA